MHAIAPNIAPEAARQNPETTGLTTSPTKSLTMGLTIGKLAQAAGVGIETIRYYQKRGLLPTPQAQGSAFRHYPPQLVQRIRFIKRAQDLGFTLDEITALLALEDGSDRDAIRHIARARLEDISQRIRDLARMQGALSHLIERCEHTDHAHGCPIIGTLVGEHDNSLGRSDAIPAQR